MYHLIRLPAAVQNETSYLQSVDSLGVMQMSRSPESVDAACVTTQLIDDIKFIHPGSITIEVLNLRPSWRMITDAPLK